MKGILFCSISGCLLLLNPGAGWAEPYLRDHSNHRIETYANEFEGKANFDFPTDQNLEHKQQKDLGQNLPADDNSNYEYGSSLPLEIGKEISAEE